MKTQLRKITGFLKKFAKDEQGSVAAYVASFAVLSLGLGALAIDTGRSTVLTTQLQNRADAGAMAGAAQLDGRDGARSRASQMAINAISQSSTLVSGGTAELTVQSVSFYQEIEPAMVLADTDENAKFIQVNMAPQTMDYVFRPASGAVDIATSTTMGAEAIAQPEPYMCHAPPLMICDLGEIDPSIDMDSTDVIGQQVVLKPAQGGDSWAPGNYGLLALPDGTIGANSLEGALAAIQPEDCYGVELGTAPGVKTNKIQNGINARFEYATDQPYPAPNVINYPQDSDLLAGTATNMGNGTWDLDSYWLDKHGTAVPIDLIDATRYQTYLYELGEPYGKLGTQTHYPIDGDLPAGYTEVTPPAENIPESVDFPDDPDYDGVPTGAVASNGASRRLVQVAVLNCVADDVKGSHNYPSSGRYLEMFITQAVPDAPEGAIFGEVVRSLTLTTTPDFHANVKLVR